MAMAPRTTGATTGCCCGRLNGWEINKHHKAKQLVHVVVLDVYHSLLINSKLWPMYVSTYVYIHTDIMIIYYMCVLLLSMWMVSNDF